MKYTAGFFIVVLVLVIGYAVAYYNSQETIIIRVKDKERIVTGSGENLSSKFLVYTDKEVFQNTDDLGLGKFNSADVQNNLEIGHKYKVDVIGWRIPFLSSYRNISRIWKVKVD